MQKITPLVGIATVTENNFTEIIKETVPTKKTQGK
jgi:hypothetical protein